MSKRLTPLVVAVSACLDSGLATHKPASIVFCARPLEVKVEVLVSLPRVSPDPPALALLPFQGHVDVEGALVLRELEVAHARDVRIE